MIDDINIIVTLGNICELYHVGIVSQITGSIIPLEQNPRNRLA